jgi:molybdopterin-guanine dinucleotide biosynthesis protein A
MDGYFPKVTVCQISENEFLNIEGSEDSFFNVNTPEDFLIALQMGKDFNGD